MTNRTLAKAKAIYKAGGVERTGPTNYRVLSTSGETYLVFVRTDRCTCPATTICSHISAVNIARACRRSRTARSKIIRH